jgi:hypothetical protein
VPGIYRTLQQCAEISSEAGGIGLAVHKVPTPNLKKHTQNKVQPQTPNPKYCTLHPQSRVKGKWPPCP